MNLPLFSLKGDFPRLWRDAKGLSQLGGCGTRPSAIARTGSDILAIRTFPRSDSLAAQAALAKIAIRSKTVRFIVIENSRLKVLTLMGHSDIETTTIYSHLADEHVDRAVEK